MSAGSQVTEPLLGNAASLSAGFVCEMPGSHSGVRSNLLFAERCKSRGLLCFREGSPAEMPGSRSQGVSSQLSSNPAPVGAARNEASPTIHRSPLRMWQTSRGEKGEAHIKSHKHHFVFPSSFSSTLLPSPPSNPLGFFFGS